MDRSTRILGCGVLFGGVFAAAGAATFWASVEGIGRPHEPRTQLILGWGGALFMLVGTAIVVAMTTAIKNRRVVAALTRQFPNEPWKWQPEWNQKSIKADTRGTAFLWFFAIVWNGISVPAAIGAWEQFRNGNRWLIIVAFFPALGLLMLVHAAVKSVRAVKFGRSVFVPSALPGVIGGGLGGVVEIPVRLSLQEDFRLALRCVRRTTVSRGEDSSTYEQKVWEKEALIALEKVTSAAGRTEVPVMFQIPPECRPTDPTDPEDGFVWRLELSTRAVEGNFIATFTVPVFRR